MKQKQLHLLVLLLLTISIKHSLAQDYFVFVSSGFSSSQSGIKQFDQNGNFIRDFVNPGDGNIAWPQDLIFLDNEEKLLVSGLNSGTIHCYNNNDGSYIEDFAPITNGPTRMTIGEDGLLYVLQWNNNAPVLRYNLDGSFVDEYTSIGINNAIGMAWDADGNFYVSSFGNNSITKFDPDGTNPTPFITGLQGPTNIWFDPNGTNDLFVANWSGNKVERYSASGDYINDLISNIVRPEGYVYLPNGNLLMGSSGSVNSIFEFESDGTPVGLFASGNGLANPNAITIKDASLFSIEEFNNTASIVTPSIGQIFTISDQAAAEFDSLKIYDSIGNLTEEIIVSKKQWNASKYAEGSYIIVGTSTKGKKITQKVIVKK